MKRVYSFELFDDKEFEFETKHKIIRFNANELAEAFNMYNEWKAKQENKEWQVYQVCRNFKDCKLFQPVYDYFNGTLFDEEAERDFNSWALIF